MNSYFEKFINMEPYFDISEEEWTYIKENFSEEDIKESLVEILMEYDLPYAEISENGRILDCFFETLTNSAVEAVPLGLRPLCKTCHALSISDIQFSELEKRFKK